MSTIESTILDWIEQQRKTYEILVKTLRIMDSKQLKELFYDIDDIQVMRRIADTSYNFCAEYIPPEPTEYEKEEYEEWAEDDLLRRNAERHEENQKGHL